MTKQTTTITLTADQLGLLARAMRSVKGYEIDDAVAWLRLHDLLARERDRLQHHAQGLPYIDPAAFQD